MGKKPKIEVPNWAKDEYELTPVSEEVTKVMENKTRKKKIIVFTTPK